MPSRAPSRKESSTFSGQIDHGSEHRRTTTKQQQNPRFGQNLKFKEKIVKGENCIRPPTSDLPFEFVKNADDLFVVKTKSYGSQDQDKIELVKYMSKVPSYLQRGEKPQDNVLNFGVLDWKSLEQWTHNREKVVVSDRFTKPVSGSCSASNGCSSRMAKASGSVHLREQLSTSCSSNPNTVHKVDFSPIVKPLSEKITDLHTSVNNLVDETKGTSKKYTHRRRDSAKIKSSKYNEKCSGQSSSSSGQKLDNSESEELKCAEVIEGLKLDDHDQHSSGKQQGIVLLFPKDFSSSGSSKVHRRASLDGNSAEYNWGSFSDLFSIDEIHPEESFSEIPHSCPLNSELDTEKELDLKLDTLIKSQGVEIPVNPSNMASHNIETSESNVEVAKSSFTNVKHLSDEIHGESSLHSRLSSGLARMTRSLSFRESSSQPPLSSTYVTAKSGPVKPEHCSNSREKVSPLRRFLDPIFRSKVSDQLREMSDDLIVKPTPIPMNKKHDPPTMKALLHLTVKSGLPLFKFVVGKNDEIFASTVKSLKKDDTSMSWLYTFYSVQKIGKRSNSWKSQQKVKPSRLGYTVVGQMKVSEPRSPSWCEKKSEGRNTVKESVLYNVELSKEDGTNSEIKTSRELAAIVVNMSDVSGKSGSFFTESNLGDCFSDSENDKLGQIVVVLPGGDHSLPLEGVPSSLITRWRNGGSCDCGGWDVGCKLRILTEKWQQRKYLQVHCDLYDQEAKQSTPLFSLIPLRDGLFSVEYDPQISSLQAFSISVALINSHNPAYYTDTKASMPITSEGPEKHAPHPPLSPVGRV